MDYENCIWGLDISTSIIGLSRQFRNQVSIQVIASNSVVFHYLETHKELEHIVKSILRMYGGVFEHDSKINALRVAEKASTTESVVISALSKSCS